MKNTKRILAALSAIAMSFAAVSCGNAEENNNQTAPAADAAQETTETTTVTTKEAKSVDMNDMQKQMMTNLAEKLPDIELRDKTIKFISHWDINPGDGQVVPPYLQLFRDKYDGKVEWVQTTWENRYDDILSLIIAKDSPDFFSAMDGDGFPNGALKGLFQPVDDYVDFSDPIWSDEGTQNTISKFVFDGKHYVAATGSSPNTVCIYNKKTIADNNLEDPAELFKNNEWTWSKFKEMCEAFSDSGSEKFGLDGYWYDSGINNSTGVPLISLDGSGKAVSNLKDPSVRKAQDFLFELERSRVYFDRTTHDNQTRGSGATGEGLGSGLTLFIPCGLWGIEDAPENTKLWGDVAGGEIMFVPMPRPDDTDTYYIDARVDNGYFLIKNAPNPEGFGAFMNCLQLTAHSRTATDVSKDQLKNVYKWNDEMIAMKDTIIELCQQNPVFDFKDGVSSDVSAMTNEIKCASINGAMTKKWDTVIEEYNDKLEFELDKANTQISKVN